MCDVTVTSISFKISTSHSLYKIPYTQNCVYRISVYVMIFTKGKMYGGFIISYGGSFESSWHSGVVFGARIYFRTNFILSKLVTL